jgi:Zn-dependent peptidase ImmA (M78 family)
MPISRMSRQELARTALRAAFEARRQAQIALQKPICIYDVAERLGTRVWFVGGASFAGVYAKGYNQIFVPTERPAGRRAFTCAHELGHWYFKHGTRVEELDFDRSDNDAPEEILANTFAAFLLMPRQAAVQAFDRRGLDPRGGDPIDIYSVACQLGVGYETLLKHLRWSLNLIDHSRMQDLLTVPPKEIRRAVLGRSAPGHLVWADDKWNEVAIDLEVGDFAVVPHGTRLCGQSAEVVGNCLYGHILEARLPGLSQAVIDNSEWASMVRVSRKQFTGRGAFRHLEEVDEDI